MALMSRNKHRGPALFQPIVCRHGTDRRAMNRLSRGCRGTLMDAAPHMTYYLLPLPILWSSKSLSLLFFSITWLFARLLFGWVDCIGELLLARMLVETLILCVYRCWLSPFVVFQDIHPVFNTYPKYPTIWPILNLLKTIENYPRLVLPTLLLSLVQNSKAEVPSTDTSAFKMAYSRAWIRMSVKILRIYYEAC